jgi:hypothetical protein
MPTNVANSPFDAITSSLFFTVGLYLVIYEYLC